METSKAREAHKAHEEPSTPRLREGEQESPAAHSDGGAQTLALSLLQCL